MSRTRNKDTWAKVTFGDVVCQVKDKVDPKKSGLTRYIAGEHMDTDDLCIHRWGEIGNAYLGPAFHMRFKPGHVLYGSRRTYLRKVAVADFEGITANTTYVIESRNPEVLLPELLPFIMQMESFHQHSIKESKGSVNPYVNFSDLAQYEFALPPMEEQKRIAEVLRAAGSLTSHLQKLVNNTAKLLEADLVSTLDHGPAPLREQPRLPSGWTFTALGDLISVRHGFAFDGKCFTEEVTDDPILLTPGNFSETGELNFPANKTKRFNGEIPDGFWLHPGDLVILMTDLTPTAFLLGVPGIITERTGPILQNQRIGLIVNQSPQMVSGEFLFYSFLGQQLRGMIRALSAGTTVHHTSPKDIYSLRIPLPPLEKQGSLCKRWDAIINSRQRAAKRLQNAREIQQGLLNSAFRAGDQ